MRCFSSPSFFICLITPLFYVHCHQNFCFFIHFFPLHETKKTQTATKPTSSLKRPTIVTKGTKTHASSRNGPSSIPIKASSAGLRQPGVSTGLTCQAFRKDGWMLSVLSFRDHRHVTAEKVFQTIWMHSNLHWLLFFLVYCKKNTKPKLHPFITDYCLTLICSARVDVVIMIGVITVFSKYVLEVEQNKSGCRFPCCLLNVCCRFAESRRCKVSNPRSQNFCQNWSSARYEAVVRRDTFKFHFYFFSFLYDFIRSKI